MTHAWITMNQAMFLKIRQLFVSFKQQNSNYNQSKCNEISKMVHILQIDTCLNKLEKKDILLDIFGNKWRNFMKYFDFF